MPKSFSPAEIELIRKKLIEKGKTLFSKYGLKKTNISDLTKAVGIAQGSFYKFYNSKEELFFEILEREEAIRDQLLHEAISSAETTREILYKLLKKSFTFIDTNPFYRSLYESKAYDLLIRKLSPETLNRHAQNDTAYFTPYIKELQDKQEIIKTNPEVIVGLFRALVLISFHKDEIGEEIYPQVIEVLSAVVAKGLTDQD